MTVIGSIPLRDFGHEWRLVEPQAPVAHPVLAPILRAEVKRLSTLIEWSLVRIQPVSLLTVAQW